MNEPFKTTERFVIQRRFPRAKSYAARHWHNVAHQPNGTESLFEDAVFKILAEAKKAKAKLIKLHPDAEHRIICEVRTYTLIED